jgi:hypothetical protein
MGKVGVFKSVGVSDMSDIEAEHDAVVSTVSAPDLFERQAVYKSVGITSDQTVVWSRYVMWHTMRSEDGPAQFYAPRVPALTSMPPITFKLIIDPTPACQTDTHGTDRCPCDGGTKRVFPGLFIY